MGPLYIGIIDAFTRNYLYIDVHSGASTRLEAQKHFYEETATI